MTKLTDSEIASILFNETRSLSGPKIAEARINIVHAIINALASPHKFPKMAPTVAKPGPGESVIYATCVTAVTNARANTVDPTSGATHFNFRKNDSSIAFQGHALKTSVGPLANSYPTTELPSSGIYANTYE